MESIITIEQQIKDLKAEGLSLRKIADKLSISLGKVQRTLNSTGNGGVSSVSEKPQNVSKSVSKCIDTPNTEQGESVADLKSRLNPILKNIYNQLDTLIKRLNNIEEDFNSRADKVIKYTVENTLRVYVTQEINKLREELKV